MSIDSIDSWPGYLIIIALLVLNALVESSKRALDSVDRNKIKEMNEDNPDNAGVKRVISLLKEPSKFHYADLVMTYFTFFCSLFTLNMIIAVRTALLENVLTPFLIGNIAFTLIFIAVSDIFPKKLALQSSESLAIGLSGFQKFIYYITLPIVKICVLFANIILLILRKETDVEDNYFSEDRVMSMLDKGQEAGEIKEEGRKMIDSIFEFDDLLAYEIMTPRTDVFMIDINDDKDEYFDELMELTHSRIPVYDGDPDNIVGILHIKDYLFKAGFDGFDNVNISEILREAYLVPETKNIDALFVELQREKQHIAILIDEYGGFSGLVSIEDIIEQIVGDIDDEFDEEDRIIDQVSESEFIVDGNVYLDDLEEETNVSLESDNSETIGGFIIDLMGEIPKEDTVYPPVKFENYNFTILSVKDRRIEKVRIVIDDSEQDDLNVNER